MVEAELREALIRLNPEIATNNDLADEVKAIMFGGMQLGIEFCLQIDLEDDSEMNRLLYG